MPLAALQATATVRRYVSSIATLHRAAGVANPCETQAVKRLRIEVLRPSPTVNPGGSKDSRPFHGLRSHALIAPASRGIGGGSSRWIQHEPAVQRDFVVVARQQSQIATRGQRSLRAAGRLRALGCYRINDRSGRRAEVRAHLIERARPIGIRLHLLARALAEPSYSTAGRRNRRDCEASHTATAH
jgi:hypothetical protein